MKNFKDKLLEADAVSDLKKLIAGDKEAAKIKKDKTNLDYMDYLFTKYEKEIEKIIKKSKLEPEEIIKLLKNI